MNTPYPPARFIVDGLLPYGVNLICGAGKIGKSWLMLDLALKVATGEPLWGMKTEKCDVLYLCLYIQYHVVSGLCKVAAQVVVVVIGLIDDSWLVGREKYYGFPHATCSGRQHQERFRPDSERYRL